MDELKLDGLDQPSYGRACWSAARSGGGPFSGDVRTFDRACPCWPVGAASVLTQLADAGVVHHHQNMGGALPRQQTVAGKRATRIVGDNHLLPVAHPQAAQRIDFERFCCRCIQPAGRFTVTWHQLRMSGLRAICEALRRRKGGRRGQVVRCGGLHSSATSARWRRYMPYCWRLSAGRSRCARLTCHFTWQLSNHPVMLPLRT